MKISLNINPYSFNKTVKDNFPTQKPLKLYERPNRDVVSFGTSDRLVLDKGHYIYRTTTALFRYDLDWLDFASYLDKNFKDKQKVNVICQACSDGSEAYTLAISLIERLGEEKAKKFFPIKAKDFDAQNISAARSGLVRLSNDDIKDLVEEGIDFSKYFVLSDKELSASDDDYSKEGTRTYQVKDIIRKKIKFEQCDVFKDISELKDNSNTVFLFRNTICWLDSYARENFFEEITQKLKPGSILALGFTPPGGQRMSNFNESVEKLGYEAVCPKYGEKLSGTYRKTKDTPLIEYGF